MGLVVVPYAKQLRSTVAVPGSVHSHAPRRVSTSTLVIRAALPVDPASVAQAVCAAAASSLVTAAWLGGRSQQAAPASPQLEPDPQQSPASQPTPEADTVQQVWDAAWAVFDKQQQQVEAEANLQSQAAYQDEPVATKPLLLLQAIKSSARVQLLALSLASLEQQVARLPAPAVLLSAIQWRDIATALLANASLAAATAWLGYVPEELQEAVRLQLAALDQDALAAVGIECPRPEGASAAAAPPQPGGWLQWRSMRRRGNAARYGGSSSSSSRSNGLAAGAEIPADSSSSSGGGGPTSGGVSRATRIDSFYWVGLEERVGLYCSVLRLLRSHSIQQRAERGVQGAAAAVRPQQPADPTLQQQQWNRWQPSISSTTQQQQQQQDEQEQQGWQEGRASQPWEGATVLPSSLALPAGPLTAALEGPGQDASLDARQAARASLNGAAEAAELRGWRATCAGVKSPSHLLAIAPAVLHDMAVLVAEAAAAGYLSDVDGGLNPSTALGAAAVLQASSSSSSSSGDGTGNEAQGPAQPVTGGGPLPSKALAAADAAALAALAPTGAAGAVALAAGAAEYLGAGERSGSGGGGLVALEASYWPTFLHRQLSSTRQLQRFTNQVLLQRWLHCHYHAVAAMYEDRMDLFGLGQGALLQVRRVPLRRVGELNGLRGPRFLMSLLLELADLAAPALRALWRQVSAFVSWLLVRLIGRSLGLIYKGIRMSLNPQQRAQQQQQERKAGSSKRRHKEQQQEQQQQRQQWPGESQEDGLPQTPSWVGLF